jgi:hypothetical protein
MTFFLLRWCQLPVLGDILPKSHYPPLNRWNPSWFYENNSFDYRSYDNSKDNLAVIVITPQYHIEVFASVAYHLHKLGYDVHAWVGAPTR